MRRATARRPTYLGVLPLLASCDLFCGGDTSPSSSGAKTVAILLGTLAVSLVAALVFFAVREMVRRVRSYDFTRSGPAARASAVLFGAATTAALVPAGFTIVAVPVGMATLQTRNDVDCFIEFDLPFALVVIAVSLIVGRALAGVTVGLLGDRAWAPMVAMVLFALTSMFLAVSGVGREGNEIPAALAAALIPLVPLGALAAESSARWLGKR